MKVAFVLQFRVRLEYAIWLNQSVSLPVCFSTPRGSIVNTLNYRAEQIPRITYDVPREEISSNSAEYDTSGLTDDPIPQLLEQT